MTSIMKRIFLALSLLLMSVTLPAQPEPGTLEYFKDGGTCAVITMGL